MSDEGLGSADVSGRWIGFYRYRSEHLGAFPITAVLAQDGLEQHQDPFIDGIDKDDALALLPFGNGLTNPRRRTFLLALMDDGSERGIDVIRLAPLARQSVKTGR